MSGNTHFLSNRLVLAWSINGLEEDATIFLGSFTV